LNSFSLTESSGRFHVMVVMDLDWDCNYFSRNLVDRLARLFLLFHCKSLIVCYLIPYRESLIVCYLIPYRKPLSDLKYPTTPFTSLCWIMISHRATATSICESNLSPKSFPSKENDGVIHHFKRLSSKKTGIMIPLPRKEDYRSFFTIPPLFPLNFKMYQVPTINPKYLIQETRLLRKKGIMIPSPRSGDYQFFLTLLSPTTPDYSTIVTNLSTDELTHVALPVSTSISARDRLSTSLCLMTVTIASSNALSIDDSSTTCDIPCAKLPSRSGPQALMDSLLISTSYLCVAFILTFACCCYLVLSISILVCFSICK